MELSYQSELLMQKKVINKISQKLFLFKIYSTNNFSIFVPFNIIVGFFIVDLA